MNTPAHAILNLAVLGGAGRRHTAPVLAGAVVPDLPIFAFYAWQKLVTGRSESAIWGDLYFRPEWQTFFDIFNSVPLALAVWIVARARGLPGLGAFSLSVLLHAACDLPVHHDDGHRHFLPISHWRFESPLSYWDPQHYGMIGAGLEGAMVLGASCVLWQRYPSATARTPLAVVNFLYATGWYMFYAS